MPFSRFRNQYEHLSQFERDRIINKMEAGWSARRVTPHRPLWLCCELVLGPVDRKYVIYMKTRLRIPSTDLSSRRPLHRNKCTRTAN
ncbi:hypothetical protein TNCV_3513001 [Trichonephila clavipes]|nr:hypothetical protein TNCV_3513001 [Trichonephila clavipes]